MPTSVIFFTTTQPCAIITYNNSCDIVFENKVQNTSELASD